MEARHLKISVVTPTLNEVGNVDELVNRVRATMVQLDLSYEHIFIDNCSSDGTTARLRELAADDPRIKVIVNQADYGHVRSPYHAFMQAQGDVVIVIASDLQDPPELIPALVAKWQEGSKIVFLVKRTSQESRVVSHLRRTYYAALGKLTSHPLVPNATGAGLYDRTVVETLRGLSDPYPYVRGLVVELGYPVATVEFDQATRKSGSSKNSLVTLYDLAMLGLTTNSRAPLRAMSGLGFILALVSLLIGFLYLVRKILAWDSFDLGLAPIAVGLFFLGAIQLVCLGVLGEYVGNIFVRVRNHPLVIEQERINFDEPRT